jgi:hypothetical protein
MKCSCVRLEKRFRLAREALLAAAFLLAPLRARLVQLAALFPLLFLLLPLFSFGIRDDAQPNERGRQATGSEAEVAPRPGIEPRSVHGYLQATLNTRKNALTTKWI